MQTDIVDKALGWLAQGKSVALLSVIATWGSSPNPVGSQMCVNETGDFTGSVSAGCIEGEAVADALKAIRSGKFKINDYIVTKAMAENSGLACGGKMTVLIQPLHDSELLTSLTAEKNQALITDLKTGQTRLVDEMDGNVSPEIKTAITSRQSQRFSPEGRDCFIAVYASPIKLMIIGAVHIAQSLAPLAKQFGFEVTLIDPRQNFASPERFPDCHVINDWPDRALKNVNLNASMAVVTLAHDPRLDDPALTAAINAGCFYIAALGSQRTHGKRLSRLQDQGFSNPQLARIHGPAGLDIGAVGADEIALSILAQLVARKNQKEI